MPFLNELIRNKRFIPLFSLSRYPGPFLFGIRSFPLVGQFLNRARFGHGPQGVQGIENDAPLTFHIARFTKHTTPRKFYK